MARHGKQYREVAKLVDPRRTYSPEEAIGLAKQAHFAKFDETVELHMRTGLDPRHADQQVRSTALLPHGLGKTVRVLVFAEGEAAQAARAAGADYVGSDDLINQIQGGWTDFDVALAQRELMGKVGRLGRVLGPRGLMPNPRSGTVIEADDIAKAVQDARQGRVEFRLDKTALLHAPFGKVSFDDEALLDNMATLVNAIVQAKPSGAKGQYIRSVTVATTMGPGIHLDLTPTLAMKPR
ncbi:MAG TPA: 50S ribosomal protein L1 [Dehalococcoidia bacterium]|jgi:large subunit ribosomal protein L1|nr:50S ribosomal protein L1 [Dehalococcoidia bacterium]